MEWIKICDQTPRDGERVLIFSEGAILCAQYSKLPLSRFTPDLHFIGDNELAGPEHFRADYWMPLPQPPQE